MTVGSNPCTAQIFCWRAFVSHFFAGLPFSSLLCRGRAAHPPTSLADGWLQAGGCRRVAAGRRVAFGRRVAAGRRAVADGPSHAARWCARFFGGWGGGARGWSSCCYGGQRGSGQLRLALMFGLLYSKNQFVGPAHVCASYCTKPNRTQACEQVPLLHVVVVLWPLPLSILQLAAAIMP